MSHRTEKSSSHHSSRDSHGSKKKSKKESQGFFSNIASAVAPLVFGSDDTSREWHKEKSRDRFHAENRHPERLPMFKYLSKREQRAILQQSDEYYGRSSSSLGQSKSDSYSRSSSRDDPSSSGHRGSVSSHHTRATSSSHHNSDHHHSGRHSSVSSRHTRATGSSRHGSSHDRSGYHGSVSSHHNSNRHHSGRNSSVSSHHTRATGSSHHSPDRHRSNAGHQDSVSGYPTHRGSYNDSNPEGQSSSISFQEPGENYRGSQPRHPSTMPSVVDSSSPDPRYENVNIYTVNRVPQYPARETALEDPATAHKVSLDNYNRPKYTYQQFDRDSVQEQTSSEHGTSHISHSRGSVSQHKKKHHSSPLQSVGEGSSLHKSSAQPPRSHHSSRSHRCQESSSHRSTDQIHVKTSNPVACRQGAPDSNSHSSRHRSERHDKLSQSQHDNSDEAGGYYEDGSLMGYWFESVHSASDQRSRKPAGSGAGVNFGARDVMCPSQVERTLSDYWRSYHSGQDSPQALFGNEAFTDEGGDDNPDEWTSVVSSEHLGAQSEVGIDSRPLRPADSISNVMVGTHGRGQRRPESLRRRVHQLRKK